MSLQDRITDVDVDLDMDMDHHHLHLHHHLQALFGVKTEHRPTCNTYRFQKYNRVGNIVFKKKIKNCNIKSTQYNTSQVKMSSHHIHNNLGIIVSYQYRVLVAPPKYSLLTGVTLSDLQGLT